MASEKLTRLKALLHPPPDWRDWEVTMILLGRPLSLPIVYAVEGVRWITPNRITWVAIGCVLAASALLVAAPGWELAAGALVFARMVLDDTDGMLARYRGQTSRFGSYLDKVGDAVGFFTLFGAMGWRATLASGSRLHLGLGLSAAFALMLMGYVKQVAKVEELSVAKARGAAAAPAAAKPAANESNAPACPRWPEFAGKLALHALLPMESDICLVAAVCAALGRFDVAVWFFAITQGVGAAAQSVLRGAAVVGLDRGRG